MGVTVYRSWWEVGSLDKIEIILLRQGDMISFKSIQIKGFRGFVDSGKIELCIPDGKTEGSGLNIFVGENGGGKTIVLKAISFLTIDSFRGQNKISSFDFNNQSNDGLIEIIGRPNEQIKYSMPLPYRRNLDIKEFRVLIKHRDRKAPNKLLSSKFGISNILEPVSRIQEWYKNSEEEISDFYLSFDNERFVGEEGLNIFYFDEARSRQAKKGFATTFSRVMDDLNWKFLKNADQSKILKKWREYYSGVVEPGLGEEIKQILKTRLGREDLSKIELELLNLKEPYNEAFFAVPTKNNLSQIPLSFLGSGVELIFSILFLRQIANQSKGSIIYCIDEPELSLHPQWQRIFFDILKEEAKTKQIFIATHSLHFIDPSLLGNTKRFYIEDNKIKFSRLTDKQAEDPKMQKLFGLENREILFSRGVILVEGIDDRMRVGNFLQKSNNDLFVMDGLQNFKRAQEMCTQLGIRFKSIVDLDYLRNYPDLLPDLSEAELEYIEEIGILNGLSKKTDNEKVLKEIIKIKNKIISESLKCLSSKILHKMSQDKGYEEKIKTKIEELKSESTFVLSKGVIEDYLDEYGQSKGKEFEDELLKIILE